MTDLISTNYTITSRPKTNSKPAYASRASVGPQFKGAPDNFISNENPVTLTKEAVLSMFEGKDRDLAKTFINEFEETGVDLEFTKTKQGNHIYACPKKEKFTNFINGMKMIPGLEDYLKSQGVTFESIEQELKESYEYNFDWNNFDQFVEGLKKADEHINRADFTMNTKMCCPQFTEEELGTIVKKRLDLLMGFGLLSRFTQDLDKSTICTITPTEATKDIIIERFGNIFSDDDCENQLLNMYQDETNFKTFKECIDYLSNYPNIVAKRAIHKTASVLSTAPDVLLNVWINKIKEWHLKLGFDNGEEIANKILNEVKTLRK